MASLTLQDRVAQQLNAGERVPVDLTDLTNDWLETNTGFKFNPFTDPAVPNYSLKDLVWGISRACRYGGQIRDEVDHYSVAEHSVLLTRHAWKELYGNRPYAELKPHELMELRTIAGHDLGEGLLTDMVRPIKKAMPEYTKIAYAFDVRLAVRFGMIFPLPKWVSELDTHILRDERAQVMNPSANVWTADSVEPLGVTVNFWSPRTAYFFMGKLLRELRFPGSEAL